MLTRSSRVVVLIGALVMMPVLAEVGLRIVRDKLPPRLPFTYDPALSAPESADRSRLFQFDPDLGWTTTPNGDARLWGARNRHNHDGLRADREYARSPAPAIRRIAAYGDSYTYCLEVDFDACWTRRLADLLPNTEVLNFGVPAYAPDQAWLRYRRDGASWRPCAVLIGHLTENINRVVNRFWPFYSPATRAAMAKPRFVLRDGGLELLPNPARQPEDLLDPVWVETHLGPHDAWFFPGTFVRNPLDRLEVVRMVRTAAYLSTRPETSTWLDSGAVERMYRPGTEPFEVLRSVLIGFAEQVRSEGATPVVVVLPSLLEVMHVRDGGAKPHAALLEALGRANIPSLDLTDDLASEARRSGAEAVMWLHFTPLGNDVVAHSLARQLPALTAGTCDPKP